MAGATSGAAPNAAPEPARPSETGHAPATARLLSGGHPSRTGERPSPLALTGKQITGPIAARQPAGPTMHRAVHVTAPPARQADR